MSIQALFFHGYGQNSHDPKLTIASTILRIRTTGCKRTRQSPYEIVGDYSDKGGLRQPGAGRIVGQCEPWGGVKYGTALNHYMFYSARGIGWQARDFYVTCDNVRCVLKPVLELNWCCAISISRGLF